LKTQTTSEGALVMCKTPIIRPADPLYMAPLLHFLWLWALQGLPFCSTSTALRLTLMVGGDTRAA
jgi:hypothetical protein